MFTWFSSFSILNANLFFCLSPSLQVENFFIMKLSDFVANQHHITSVTAHQCSLQKDLLHVFLSFKPICRYRCVATGYWKFINAHISCLLQSAQQSLLISHLKYARAQNNTLFNLLLLPPMCLILIVSDAYYI